jgi:hypothetical protein
MTRADTAILTFSSTSQPVRPATMRVTGNEAPTIRLRSGLPGPDSIRAYLDGVPVGETVITFERPWTFVVATMVGILVGGSARFFGGKRRKPIRYLLWDILKGAPFGTIAAAASAIGLDLLQLRLDDPGTWIAVMVTAALGAWTGSRILDPVVPATP